jgi:hypothetical protein
VRRVPAEYIVLASFGATALFWFWLAFFGSLRISGSGYVVGILAICFVGLGISACWSLLLRKTAGAWLSSIFYGVQVFSFPLPVGEPFKFHSLPTIYYRILGDASAPVSINLLSLLLFIFSLGVLAHYRARAANIAQVPPNTSFERTREG